MCIQHNAYYKSCNHTTSYPDIPPITHCRVYIFTGYCFYRRTETEIFTASLCGVCDKDFRFDRKLNVVPKGERYRELEKRDVWTGKGVDGEEILNEKEALMGDLGVMGELVTETVYDGDDKSRERERYVHRVPEYYRDSDRVHGRRKAKPAFGDWEVVERHEVEGYEDFVRAQASANGNGSEMEEDSTCRGVGEQKEQAQAYGDNEADKEGSGQREQNEQKLTWFNGIDGEVSSIKEFGRLDRPRMIGLTMDDIWFGAFFGRGRTPGGE